MKRKSSLEKRTCSILLCLVLVLSGLMVPAREVQAEETSNVKAINFGTKNIIDPAVPGSDGAMWEGCYVYYGNYDADGDGTAEPVKYRVLDASTTDYSADSKTQTMLLDCDSILYYQRFDNDGEADETDKDANDWSISDVKASLNGTESTVGFLQTAFTTTEKNAIAKSTKASHALTTDSLWKDTFVNYVALDGEQIFLLDVEDVSNEAYGYNITYEACGTRKKTGSSIDFWWLRSGSNSIDYFAGYVDSDGMIDCRKVDSDRPGVSPALNLNLTAVLFSSQSAVSKASPLTSESAEVSTTTDTEWKLTLKDSGKKVALTKGKRVMKASDGTITVPYTYTDKAETDREKINQISVMITDKAYDAEKEANAQEAQILYYGALTNIKNAEGIGSTVAETTTGTGTFAFPDALTGKKQGVDYHVYLLAEHVGEENNTDYASEPLEVEVKTPIDTVEVPSIANPIATLPFVTEWNISATGVSSKATIVWSKDGKAVNGNAKLNTTYEASVTLTAEDGYVFVDTTSVTWNGSTVAKEGITLNADGTLTVALGKFTSVSELTVDDSKLSANSDGTVTYVAPVNKNKTTVTIPNTVTIGGVTYKVTAIGKNAFANCKKLKTVKLGKNVTTIGDKAFYKCTALTKITIPNKVKTIGKSAFEGCTKLTTVTIGKGVTKIGAKAFYNCKKLKKLTIKSTKLKAKKVGSKAFSKTPKSMTVKVPKKKLKNYKSMLIKRGVKRQAKFKKI